jgi:hypothetical protein
MDPLASGFIPAELGCIWIGVEPPHGGRDPHQFKRLIRQLGTRETVAADGE